MHVSWVDRLTIIGWVVVLVVTAFFSMRYMIRFRQQVKRNRDAGMYNDPDFKRQIRPLNIMRYSLVAVEVLSLVPAIWANKLGVPPEIWFPIFVIIILAITVVLYVIDHRWRKLMTKGIE